MTGSQGHRPVYHRLANNRTQTFADAAKVALSAELWGRPRRNGLVPRVKAYLGPLPSGASGIEFSTEVAADPSTPPKTAYWTVGRPGVRSDGEFAKIPVRISVVHYNFP
jgi:hypothetical protein